MHREPPPLPPSRIPRPESQALLRYPNRNQSPHHVPLFCKKHRLFPSWFILFLILSSNPRWPDYQSPLRTNLYLISDIGCTEGDKIYVNHSSSYRTLRSQSYEILFILFFKSLSDGKHTNPGCFPLPRSSL